MTSYWPFRCDLRFGITGLVPGPGATRTRSSCGVSAPVVGLTSGDSDVRTSNRSGASSSTSM
ncbi:hypothetical protein BGW80DRAFT_1346645, partial [Lactifluus volemus]